MCSYKHDVAPGAAAVLLVLLLHIVSKDVYVTPILRQTLPRVTLLNRTYQVLLLPLLPQRKTADPLMSFHHRGEM